MSKPPRYTARYLTQSGNGNGVYLAEDFDKVWAENERLRARVAELSRDDWPDHERDALKAENERLRAELAHKDAYYAQFDLMPKASADAAKEQ